MTPSINHLSPRLTALTQNHKQWQETIGAHYDAVIETLLAHVEALRREREEYRRRAFTEPIAALQHEMNTARTEWQLQLQQFLPPITSSESHRALVPVVCSLFHIYDTNMDAEEGVGHRLPWDVVGGVNATLFAELTVTVALSVDEYKGKRINNEDMSGHVIALQGSVSGALEVYTPLVGRGVTLDLSALEGIERLGRCCLSGIGNRGDSDRKSIIGIWLGSSFHRVSVIGDRFCNNRCLEELQIDVDGLQNVTSIRGHFLSGCSALRSVDLRPLRNVTAIRSCFLEDCRSLESIDLSPFEQVTSIGYSFLIDCSSLATVDLSSLRRIKEIDLYSWFSGCGSLCGVLDLTPLQNVVRVADEDEENVDGFLHVYNGDCDRDEPHGRDHALHIRVPKANILLVDAVKESLATYKLRDRLSADYC